MNGFDFCQNLKNLKLGPFFGTFWVLLIRQDFFSEIEPRHL